MPTLHSAVLTPVETLITNERKRLRGQVLDTTPDSARADAFKHIERLGNEALLACALENLLKTCGQELEKLIKQLDRLAHAQVAHIDAAQSATGSTPHGIGAYRVASQAVVVLDDKTATRKQRLNAILTALLQHQRQIKRLVSDSALHAQATAAKHFRIHTEPLTTPAAFDALDTLNGIGQHLHELEAELNPPFSLPT